MFQNLRFSPFGRFPNFSLVFLFSVVLFPLSPFLSSPLTGPMGVFKYQGPDRVLSDDPFLWKPKLV